MSAKRPFTQSSTWQILFGDAIVPRCVPFTYRLYLLIKKLQRSCAKRRSAKQTDPASVSAAGKSMAAAGEEVFVKKPRLGGGTGPLINKTVSSIDEDLTQPDVSVVVRDLTRFKALLEEKGLSTTSAAGSFKKKDFVPFKEKNKLWENAWLLTHAAPVAGEKVLDIGGASTLFSFYLAWKGAAVSVVDNDWGLHGLIYNARYVAHVMLWPMTVFNRDVREPLPFADSSFDKVYCVCVLEHLSPSVRQKTMAEVHRVLKPGGICALTIDYSAGRCESAMDQGLRFGHPKTLQRDVLAPSRLGIWGNQVLTDDCPPEFFLGALFLRKG